MKKIFLALLVSAFTLGPAMADGSYRSKPCDSGCKKECCIKKASGKAWDGTKFLLKLPFRLVSSAAVGVYGLATDFDLDGFKEGYEAI